MRIVRIVSMVIAVLVFLGTVIGSHWSSKLEAREYTDEQIKALRTDLSDIMDSKTESIEKKIDKVDNKVEKIEDDVVQLGKTTARIEQLLKDMTAMRQPVGRHP